jgi:hypothetical protein
MVVGDDDGGVVAVVAVVIPAEILAGVPRPAPRGDGEKRIANGRRRPKLGYP